MKKTLLLVILLFSWATVPAQIWAGLDQVICGSDSVTLGAQVDYVAPTLVYANGANLTDDQYSDVIALGFNFTFFGNTYDKLVFSSNNYITFDTTVATGYSNWDITGPAPTAGNTPTNAILGPWQDVNPSPFPPPPVYAVMYGIYGPPGQRVFVAGFCETPMYSCTGLLFSSQIKLFEADNHIEMHIQSKPLCTNWNYGHAIQAVTNSDLSSTVVVPGRNAGTATAPVTWTVNQDGMSFFPVGTSYFSFPIAFAPTVFSNIPPVVEWFDSTGTSIGIGDTIQVLPPGNMTYYASVLICGNQQTISDTVNIQFSGLNPLWDVDSVICKGDSTGNITSLSTGNAVPLSYLWSTGDTTADLLNISAGTYFVTLTDQEGCWVSDTVDVFEADSLLFNPVVEDDQCNNGVGRVIPNIAGGVLPYQILWSNGSVSDTLSNVTAGVYSLICTDALGCVHTDTFTVGNMDFTVVIDSILGLPEACGRADGFIEVAASGGTSPYLYEWSDGSTGSLISGLMTGFYDLTVSDLNGCTAYGQYFVPYHEAPIPGIVGPDSVDTADPYATFYDTTDAIASWTWQFGDGSSGIDSVVTHAYQQDGEYLVSLTVTDSMGCEGITTKTLFVVEEFFYYVPNAFTPNQDGTNELFFPVILGADPTTYLFQIYSRNGQMIWESSDLSTGWNGTVDNIGTEAKQDVFTWRLYFRTFSGREIVEKGTITLIR